jgi:hypothetical protein
MLPVFGGHVLRRAHDQSCLRQRTVGPTDFIDERPRETKVEKLDAVARQEDVRGFQIAVDDAAGMKGIKSAEHLQANAYGFGEWYRATIQAR